MQSIRILPLLLITLLGTQCKRERYGCTDYRASNYDASANIDDGSCDYSPQYYYDNCEPAADGNLLISNRTGSTLYLYKNYSEGSSGTDAFITCIPSDTSEFLVYIPNDNLGVCQLQIWKADEVSDRNTPGMQQVYRQWSVALSNSTLRGERATWLITGSNQVAGTGTLLISYPDEDAFGHEIIYQVDVLLNSRNGARLAALQPGVSQKKVSIDYGVHYLYHHYWYSDPNSALGTIEDLGWAETSEVVINEYHPEAIIEIPAFVSDAGKYGQLTVINRSSHVVNVYAEDRLIEDICRVEGSSQGLSSIPANSQTTFVIPVSEYTLYCKPINGGIQDVFKNVSVVQGENTQLTSGVNYKTIQVANKTGYTLGLFTPDEQFLGLVINGYKTSSAYTVNSEYDSLILIDFSREHCAGIQYAGNVTVNDVKAYEQNQLVFDQEWQQTDGIYQSPVIDNQQSTLMQAILVCVEPILLSFEYNVSSERNYDKFRFISQGTEELLRSGETGWDQYSQRFEAGTYTLVWSFSKDQSRAEGRDNVWLRNVNIQKMH